MLTGASLLASFGIASSGAGICNPFPRFPPLAPLDPLTLRGALLSKVLRTLGRPIFESLIFRDRVCLRRAVVLFRCTRRALSPFSGILLFFPILFLHPVVLSFHATGAEIHFVSPAFPAEPRPSPCYVGLRQPNRFIPGQCPPPNFCSATYLFFLVSQSHWETTSRLTLSGSPVRRLL